MEPINNKEGIPFAHYCAQWRSLDPEEAAVRCAVPYEAGELAVRLYGVRYYLRWPEFSIRASRPDGFALDNLPAQILLMRFFLSGRAAAPTGTFLTYRETPWGAVYLQPFTGRCLNRAAFTFGPKIPAFCAAMEAMGGQKLTHGDASYALDALENFTVRIIVWEGDEEFPPNSQILFSDNFPQVFSAEDMAVICDILISQGKQKMQALF